jgi:predicted membrane chloride channel (bestrophin family)
MAAALSQRLCLPTMIEIYGEQQCAMGELVNTTREMGRSKTVVIEKYQAKVVKRVEQAAFLSLKTQPAMIKRIYGGQAAMEELVNTTRELQRYQWIVVKKVQAENNNVMVVIGNETVMEQENNYCCQSVSRSVCL